MKIINKLLFFNGKKPRKVINVIRNWEIIKTFDMEEIHRFATEKYINFGGDMEDPDYINVWLSKEDIMNFRDGLQRFDENKKDKYERICDDILEKIEEGYKCVYGSERQGPWG